MQAAAPKKGFQITESKVAAPAGARTIQVEEEKKLAGDNEYDPEGDDLWHNADGTRAGQPTGSTLGLKTVRI